MDKFFSDGQGDHPGACLLYLRGFPRPHQLLHTGALKQSNIEIRVADATCQTYSVQYFFILFQMMFYSILYALGLFLSLLARWAPWPRWWAICRRRKIRTVLVVLFSSRRLVLQMFFKEQQLFRDLRRFLHDNDIPIDLSQRVTRFLQHAYRLHTSQSVDSEAERDSL